MTHLTSLWAQRYGLPDPAMPAHEVRAATDRSLRACYVRLTAAALALEIGGDRTRDAVAALRDGWSTPQAERAAAELGTASDRLADLCHGMARRMSTLAAAVDAAHGEVDEAYARADAAIAAELLDAEPVQTNVAEVARLTHGRSQLVTQMHAATSSAAGRLEDAATEAAGGLAVDPRELLPANLTADAPASAGAGAATQSAAHADAANRAALNADLHARDARRVQFASAVRGALDQAARSAGGAQLLSYDPDGNRGQGAAAVATGDVARADAVSVLVPGVGNSPMDMFGTVRLAADLATATASSGSPGMTSAAVVWFGYDIPLSWKDDRLPAGGRDPVIAALGDSVIALDATAAVPAAASLSAFTQAVRSMMAPSAGLTLIGHSYGSTVVSQAARRLDGNACVDDIVLLGSPGAGSHLASADDYRAVPADHVYTLAFPADPVPSGVTDVVASLLNPIGLLARSLALGRGGGPFGADPNAPAFGAQAIMAPSGVTWNGGVDFAQHALDNYLSGPALGAVAAVTAGRYSRVPVRGAG